MSRNSNRKSGRNPLDGASPELASPAMRGEVDLLSLALRYRWMLGLTFLSGLALGQLAYMKLGPRYEADSRILVSRKVEVPIKDAETASFGDRAEHIALIMSPLIVGKAVEKHNLGELPSLAGEDDPEEEILDWLRVTRTAGRDRSFLNVLEVRYENPSAKDARAVCEAIIDAYNDYLADTRKAHTTEVVELISHAREDLARQLREKEEEYLAFRDSSPIIWRTAPGAQGQPGDVTNVHRERILAVEEDRRKNLIRQAEIEARIDVLQEAISQGESPEQLEILVRGFLQRDTGAAETSQFQALQEQASLDAQLVPLLLEESRLRRNLGLEHPDVLEVRRRVTTLLEFYRRKGIRLPQLDEYDTTSAEQQEFNFGSLYMRYLRQELAELRHRFEVLGRLFDQESKLAKDATRYQLRDQSLNDEILRIKTLWQAVVDRFNKLNLTRDTAGYSMQQISPVRTSLVIKRQIKFLIAGGAVLTLMVFGLLYLRTLQDTVIHSVEDIRNSLELPVLGAIPAFEGATSAELARSRYPAVSPQLCYLHRPGSGEAEAFRSVRTALSVCAAADDSRVIQVSSPVPGDGKSTFAANLAVALSQSGRRVLLIDADLRRPTIQQVFGLRENIGLTEILHGEIDWQTARQETVIDGLSIITAGTLPASPSELLASVRFEQLLAAARAEFDMVIVDTPPLLAVSDPCVVAPQVDGLLLLLRLQKNSRAEVLRAAELLETHGVHVLGVVANDLELGDTSSYSGPGGYLSNEPAAEPRPAREPVAVGATVGASQVPVSPVPPPAPTGGIEHRPPQDV